MAATRKRPLQVHQEEEEEVASSGVKRLRLGSIYDYDKLAAVGEGQEGVVFKAKHRRTGENVAIKWVRGAADHRAFVREVGCLAACRGHPNIVEIRDVVDDANTGDMFIVMDFHDRTLRDDLEQLSVIGEDTARSMMRDLVAAVNALHDAGVMHRDIKPDNVLVSDTNGLKLCDFGAATPVKAPGKPYEESRVGTLLYTSPEQLAESELYGPAVDMWALGCIMAEILVGLPLFDDMSSDEERIQEMADMGDRIKSTGTCKLFDELPELSAAGREVLAGLLAFDPDERMTAAEALDHRWFTGDKPQRR